MQGLYHGCQFRNRNGSRRELQMGTIGLVPMNNRCWRPTKMKYLERIPDHTRQRARLHKKAHTELEYNVKEAIHDTLSTVHKDNLDISTHFKILSIKDVK